MLLNSFVRGGIRHLKRTKIYNAANSFTVENQHKRCTHTSSNEIGIIGVPFAKGQPKSGVQQAPSKLRDAGIIRNLEMMGYSVTDYGDLVFELLRDDPPSYNIKNPRSIGKAIKKMAVQCQDIIQSGKVCLTLGGDHSMSIGTVYGHAQAEKDMTVVWVDAHADINPPLASMSGNIHGMVLSFLVHELREYVPKVAGFEWLKSCINAKDITYIGLRDIDPAERYIIDKFGINCYTMQDIDKHGISYVLEHALDKSNPGLKRPIHLSYDIDSLDPAISPSTGTPVPGGMTIREGMYVAEELSNTGMLRAIDMVEVNTTLGDHRDQAVTIYSAVEVVSSCFGKRRKGQAPLDYELPRP